MSHCKYIWLGPNVPEFPARFEFEEQVFTKVPEPPAAQAPTSVFDVPSAFEEFAWKVLLITPEAVI